MVQLLYRRPDGWYIKRRMTSYLILRYVCNGLSFAKIQNTFEVNGFNNS